MKLHEAPSPGALQRFDAVLVDSEFLAGDRFSIADITMGCALGFAKMVKLQLPFDLPGISRYHQALQARPSFQNS